MIGGGVIQLGGRRTTSGGGGGGLTNVNVIDITEAAAQAAALSGTFLSGRTYHITDAYGGTADIYLKAISTSELEKRGSGNFTNANTVTPVACEMAYDLADGVITEVYEPVRNNRIRRDDIFALFLMNCIDQFPFDDPLCMNVSGNEFNLYITGTVQMDQVVFDAGSFLQTDSTGAGSTPQVSYSHLQVQAGLMLNNSIVIGSVLESSKTIVLNNNAKIANCTCGQSLVLDGNLIQGIHFQRTDSGAPLTFPASIHYRTTNTVSDPVIPLTVGEAFSTKVASALVAGALYELSNAYGGTCTIKLRAISNDKFDFAGRGIFTNGASGVPIDAVMDYDINTDILLGVHFPEKNIHFTRVDTSSSALDQIDFTNGNLYNITCIGSSGIISADSAVQRVRIEYSIFEVIGGSVLEDADAFGTNITLDDACYFSGTADFGSTVTLASKNAFTSVHIGKNKVVSPPTDYDATNAMIDGVESTFEVFIDPDGAGRLDMADFQFAGIIRVQDGTNALQKFNNFPTDHIFCVVPDGVSLDVQDKSVSGTGNIYLQVAGTTTLDGTKDHTLVFRSGLNDYTKVFEIGSWLAPTA